MPIVSDKELLDSAAAYKAAVLQHEARMRERDVAQNMLVQMNEKCEVESKKVRDTELTLAKKMISRSYRCVLLDGDTYTLQDGRTVILGTDIVQLHVEAE